MPTAELVTMSAKELDRLTVIECALENCAMQVPRPRSAVSGGSAVRIAGPQKYYTCPTPVDVNPIKALGASQRLN